MKTLNPSVTDSLAQEENQSESVAGSFLVVLPRRLEMNEVKVTVTIFSNTGSSRCVYCINPIQITQANKNILDFLPLWRLSPAALQRLSPLNIYRGQDLNTLAVPTAERQQALKPLLRSLGRLPRLFRHLPFASIFRMDSDKHTGEKVTEV